MAFGMVHSLLGDCSDGLDEAVLASCELKLPALWTGHLDVDDGRRHVDLWHCDIWGSLINLQLQVLHRFHKGVEVGLVGAHRLGHG